jgi:Rieske Fe-S protein
MIQIKINRKKFLKLAAAAIVLPFLVIWDNIVRRTTKQRAVNSKITLPADVTSGITFYKSIILIKVDNDLQVFSALCTHLGCKINKLEDGKLICPCHGSQFDPHGKVLKGPAAASLKKLNYKTDQKTKEIIVFDA